MSCFKVTVFGSDGEEKISCDAGTKNHTYDENPCTYCAEMSSSSQDDASGSDGCCRKLKKINRNGLVAKCTLLLDMPCFTLWEFKRREYINFVRKR
jgi:hypothetical protein